LLHEVDECAFYTYFYSGSYSVIDIVEARLMNAGDSGAWWGGCAGDWTGCYLLGSDQNQAVINQYWNYSYNNIAGQSDPEADNGGQLHMGDYLQNALATDTKWHHCLWVADGAYATFYVDGQTVSRGAYLYGANGTINTTREHAIGGVWGCGSVCGYPCERAWPSTSSSTVRL
jgi:hypothetical protein